MLPDRVTIAAHAPSQRRRPRPPAATPAALLQAPAVAPAATSKDVCRVAVLGASGYTGAEVVRLSALHPHLKITALTGEKQAGKVGAAAAGLRPCFCTPLGSGGGPGRHG